MEPFNVETRGDILSSKKGIHLILLRHSSKNEIPDNALSTQIFV
jgi:hypothetical protein